MFSAAKRVVRGKCSCCGVDKDEDTKMYVLDIRDCNMVARTWEPKLIESDVDFAACLRCWKFIGEYIHARVQVTSFG